MKKIVILFTTITLVIGSFSIFPISKISAEAEDTIQTGDTLQILFEKYQLNQNETEIIDARFLNKEKIEHSPMTMIEKKDDSLTISNKEENLIARLVHAEAKGEPYVGKVAVATVVLNRVEHKEFPDTVKEVIYEENAFEPVQNGSIDDSANKEAVKAVQEALTNQEKDDELLYFYNPETATSDWIFTREVIKTIGNHSFAI